MNLKKSSFFLLSLLIIVMILLYLKPNDRQQQNPSKNPPASSARRNIVVKAIEKAMPSVVNIGAERIVTPSGDHKDTPFQEVFDEFLTAQDRQKTYSLGSGFIIDGSGLIVTNAHVVARASRVRITLSSGKTYDAATIADDPMNDIALLKIRCPPPDLKVIECDNSGRLYLGETVIAVGNPFGLDSSISVGTLSGKMRKFTYRGRVIFSDILQTDAIVYPGNSGGPLINIDGQVIGMNMSVYENAPGIGFAIPLFRIENVIAKWMIPERFEYLSFGIVPGLKELENGMRLVIIADVIANSPAAKAGLKRGDVIESLNGHRIYDLLDLSRRLICLKKEVPVAIGIAGAKTYYITPRAISYPDAFANAKNKLGLELSSVTPALAKRLPFCQDSGLLLSGILPDTASELKRGDLLIKLNNHNINTSTDLAAALAQLHYNDSAEAVFLSPLMINNKIYLSRRMVNLRVR